MPTKTTSKSATRKPAAKPAAAKTSAPKVAAAAPSGGGSAVSKAKPVAQKVEPGKPSARTHAPAAAKIERAAASKPASGKPAAKHAPSVSLIDRPGRSKELKDGQGKTVLPPISKILPKLEPSAPARVEPVAPPTPASTPQTSTATLVEAEPDGAAASAEVEEQKILHIKPPIIVKDFAAQLRLKNFQLIKELMDGFNIFANQNQTIEPDVAAKIAENHGFILEKERREKGAGVHKVEQPVVAPPPPGDRESGRTQAASTGDHVYGPCRSWEDFVDGRDSQDASGCGRGRRDYATHRRVHGRASGDKVTFIDTPGHAAFTAMRARGANVTDIVVLVVAADDGVMPQTIEAINHAKAAPHVKIMVALNKIDLPGANIDRAKKQLQECGLMPEDWGGETIVCPVSATRGTGIDHLLEMMTLQAEVMELKASPTATPRGTVIEAQIEPGRGPTATVIVQMGTLKIGDPFICGDYSGKVKSLLDGQGKQIKEAGPSTAVRVLGFTGLPNAGDELLVMESERAAKMLSDERVEAKRANKLTVPQRATLESLLQDAAGKKLLKIVLKCDAQGSLEAITGALNQIESKKIDLEIIHAAVGPISESDILLASASDAVVVGFNVKVESMAVPAAKREGVQVKLYSIIYELIDQLKDAMAGLLDPELRETVIGHAEVKQVFKLSKGIVAGCLVTDGRIARAARARVLRKRQPVYDGGLSTLRRFQDDVKEVRSGLECGIKLGDFSEYQVGDVIECYQLEQFAQKL